MQSDLASLSLDPTLFTLLVRGRFQKYIMPERRNNAQFLCMRWQREEIWPTLKTSWMRGAWQRRENYAEPIVSCVANSRELRVLREKRKLGEQNPRKSFAFRLPIAFGTPRDASWKCQRSRFASLLRPLLRICFKTQRRYETQRGT